MTEGENLAGAYSEQPWIGWLCLILIAIFSTLTWMVGRWALQRDGRPVLLGFWGASIAIAFSAIVWGTSGQPLWQWEGIAYGAVNSIGACLVTMLTYACLKIGPAGPTTAFGSIGFVWPALISLVFLRQTSPNLWLLTGLISTGAGLALIGFTSMQGTNNSSTTQRLVSSRTMSPRWLAMAMGGWVGAGLSQTSQMFYAAGRPENPGAFMLHGNVICLGIFFFLARGRGGVRWGREAVGGLAIGILGSLCLVLTLRALRTIGAEVVFPVITAAPILAMMIAGRIFYQERLRRMTWAGVTVIVIGVILLAYGNAGQTRDLVSK